MNRSRRPDLLLIFTDEQRRDTLRCYGNDPLKMPNLNRLAEPSCVFDKAHCVNPLCTSRGSMLTGLYPHAHRATDHNVPMRAGARCLPELLSDAARAAYRIEYDGKWHLGDEWYAQPGYERFISIEDIYWKHFSAKRDPRARSDYHHHLLSEGFTLGTGDTFPRAFAAHLARRCGRHRDTGRTRVILNRKTNHERPDEDRHTRRDARSAERFRSGRAH